jgi:hypothetical protein
MLLLQRRRPALAAFVWRTGFLSTLWRAQCAVLAASSLSNASKMQPAYVLNLVAVVLGACAPCTGFQLHVFNLRFEAV